MRVLQYGGLNNYQYYILWVPSYMYRVQNTILIIQAPILNPRAAAALARKPTHPYTFNAVQRVGT